MQMGRRGGDSERHREVRRQKQAVPHPRMVDKNWDGYLRSEGDPKPRPDHPAQGSSSKKISPHNFWL